MDHSSAKAEQTIRQAGWYYVYTKGDHRHFKHATKPGEGHHPRQPERPEHQNLEQHHAAGRAEIDPLAAL